MDKNLPYIERDVSWLSFNYRVLQEAKDPNVPLFERIKFLAIYSSNLGEFFAVRVAQHRNLIRVGKKTKRELEIHPRQVLRQILSIVNEQQEEFSRIFEEEIIPELKQHHIFLKRRLDLSKDQERFVETYFMDHMLPYVQPVLLVKDKIRPFLANSELYLAVMMRSKGKPEAPLQYAIVKIPSDHLPRFIELPTEDGQYNIIMIDDIVRHSITWLFPGYEVLDTYSIKLNRDAELYIDDEYSGDLLQKIKNSLQRRNVGPASRLVYDRTMPTEFLEYLQTVLELENFDLLPEGRYHNNFDFFKFPDFGMKHLKLMPLSPLKVPALEDAPDIFERMRQKDYLLHVPYHRFDSLVKFFRQASVDPSVTHIKIIQYRVGSESQIMESMIEAMKHGKQVSAFVEVKARFDEEANLNWGERLSEAGVKVHYSWPGLKVHSKLALVRRIENDNPVLYAYLSTGNFHEQTAKVYSDFGLFTTDQRMTSEILKIFSLLESKKLPENGFEHMLVGQFNLRSGLEDLIKYEIEAAGRGEEAEIILKMNSLQDPQMIELLYQASMQGVKIRLIIRGICCLVPNVKKFSENIRGISIVDRYLEHARVFVFHHSGEEIMYVSSADWMTRNLSYRIESTFPIYDPAIKRTIMDLINLQWSDNVKARILDKNRKNKYVKHDSDVRIQSQLETYYYLKRLQEQEQVEFEMSESGEN